MKFPDFSLIFSKKVDFPWLSLISKRDFEIPWFSLIFPDAGHPVQPHDGGQTNGQMDIPNLVSIRDQMGEQNNPTGSRAQKSLKSAIGYGFNPNSIKGKQGVF